MAVSPVLPAVDGREAGPDVSRPRIGGSVVTSLVGKAAEMVTLLLLATVVPRALGPDAYGHFSVPLTVVTLGSLALVLGGPTVMARFVPTVPVDQRPALARSLGLRLAAGRAAQLAVVAVLAAVAVVVAPERFRAAETALVVLALALNVTATLLLQPTLGLGRAGPWSTRYPLQNAVLIVGVLVLHERHGLMGGIVAIVVAAVVAAGFGAIAARPLLRADLSGVPLPDGALRFGVMQASGAGLTQVAQRGGVLAVALLASTGPEAGYTALALGIALGVTYAVLQAFTVSLPHLSDHDEGEATLRRLAAALMAVLIPAALTVAVLIDDLVPLVFGDEYGPAAGAFGPALGLVVLAPLSALLVQISALRLRPGVAAAGGAAAVVAFAVVAALAVPTWGATGGTAAALAGVGTSAVVSLAVLPGAVGWRLISASAVGVAGTLLLAAGVT